MDVDALDQMMMGRLAPEEQEEEKQEPEVYVPKEDEQVLEAVTTYTATQPSHATIEVGDRVLMGEVAENGSWVMVTKLDTRERAGSGWIPVDAVKLVGKDGTLLPFPVPKKATPVVVAPKGTGWSTPTEDESSDEEEEGGDSEDDETSSEWEGEEGEELPIDRCPGCRKSLAKYGGQLAKVDERWWHPGCMICVSCSQPLGSTYAVLHGRWWCNSCAVEERARLNDVPKCAKCGQNCDEGTESLLAGGKNYHLHCFTCTICSCELFGPGKDGYIQEGENAICAECWESQQEEDAVEKCYVCEQDILDDTLICLNEDMFFHQSCFKCAACDAEFEDDVRLLAKQPYCPACATEVSRAFFEPPLQLNTLPRSKKQKLRQSLKRLRWRKGEVCFICQEPMGDPQVEGDDAVRYCRQKWLLIDLTLFLSFILVLWATRITSVALYVQIVNVTFSILVSLTQVVWASAPIVLPRMRLKKSLLHWKMAGVLLAEKVLVIICCCTLLLTQHVS